MNLTPDSIFPIFSKYDVFISFRGEDTRKKFTSHLHEALVLKNIKTYIDEETLRKGDEISPALLKAIRESKISLIIFSENYASSKWCLDELLHILKFREEKGQIVIPIFYDVDPSYVRNQKESYDSAFRAHAQSKKCGKKKLRKWRTALRNAGNLSGWDSRGRNEAKLIKRIVKNVENTLKSFRSLTTEDLKNLVGMDKRLKQIEQLLCIGSPDVRRIGFCGMGGMGKSTLARFVFLRLSSQFEGCCFLENVREESERHGLDYLESKLFSELLEEEDMIDVVSHSVRNRIRQQKVLIVLDDVDDAEQLERLAGDHTWCGPGSRIIITTRDKSLLRYCADHVYELNELNFDESFHVFSMTAFGTESYLNDEDYVQLSKRMVMYARGHPLLVKVLGSFLRAGTKEKWKTTLDKLKAVVGFGTFHHILRLCFEGLEDAEKDILLHIAFLKGKDKGFIERKLEECGSSYGRKGIEALMEKSLISMKADGQVSMHDMVQKVAWQILREEYTKLEPGKSSWSLITQAIYHVWRTNIEFGTVKGGYFDLSRIDYEELQPTLKMLAKRYYPSNYLPPMIYPHNLVGLDMPGCHVTRFLNETQDTSSSVRLFISYEGQWSNTQGHWSFEGHKAKGITVSKDSTYYELVERLCSSLRVDRSQYDLDMRFLVNSAVPMPPFEIENDEDVKFFIGENYGKDSQRYPLCITLVRKHIS